MLGLLRVAAVTDDDRPKLVRWGPVGGLSSDGEHARGLPLLVGQLGAADSARCQDVIVQVEAGRWRYGACASSIRRTRWGTATLGRIGSWERLLQK